MRESESDLAALQELLDRSYAAAGPHLLSIHTPERRLGARQVSERLTGMCLLVLATVTADGRPIVGPVDGIFFRGAFHFGTSARSVRWRHIRRQPYVSATHVPGEELAVTVHGRAVPVDTRAPEHAALFDTIVGIYAPRYGTDWVDEFLESESDPPTYARIDAERMFAFFMPPT